MKPPVRPRPAKGIAVVIVIAVAAIASCAWTCSGTRPEADSQPGSGFSRSPVP